MDRITKVTSSSDSKETYFINGLPDFVASLSNEERFGKDRFIVEVTEFVCQAYEVFDSYDEAKQFLDEFLEKRIKTAEEHCDFEDDVTDTVEPTEPEVPQELLEPSLPPLPQCCKYCEEPILRYHRDAGFPTEDDEPVLSDSEKLDKIISLLEEIRDKL